MTESFVNADVIVIGAGIAGLMVAQTLQDNDIDVLVLDKGRSVGGRLATRRIGNGLADHGAQFFTVRDPIFQQHVDQWLADDVAFVWSHGWSDGSLLKTPSDGHPRYAVRGGLNRLARHLAKDVQRVQVNVRIATATRDEQGWILQDQDGHLFTCRMLVLTPPVPQSLQLLEDGATTLTETERAALERISYAPCLCGMFWIEGGIALPAPGAIQRKNSNVHWIADNQAKGISPEATIITLQANERYSKQMWAAPDEHILGALRTNLQVFLEPQAKIVEEQLKRWKYSAVEVTHPERYLITEEAPYAVFAGDAFGGPRVEGAFLSGIATGEALVARLR